MYIFLLKTNLQPPKGNIVTFWSNSVYFFQYLLQCALCIVHCEKMQRLEIMNAIRHHSEKLGCLSHRKVCMYLPNVPKTMINWSSMWGRGVLTGGGFELNFQRWWWWFFFFWCWWSGQQRHMCPRIPRRTRPEISERCNSSKILIFSKVDAFLHSSVLNLKKRLQCLHFQLFQTCDWKTSNVDYYSCSSAVPGKRCFKHIPQKGFSRWKLLCIMIPETVDNDVEDGAFHDDTKNIPQSEEGRLRQVKTVVCFSPNQPLFMCDSARNPFF